MTLQHDLDAHCFQTIKATSIDESILNVVISFTTEDGQWISITLLWILISYLSQVLVPSPHGDFLVVILRILVGILNGPFVSKDRLLALSMILVQAHSSGFTSLPFKVILNKQFKKLYHNTIASKWLLLTWFSELLHEFPPPFLLWSFLLCPYLIGKYKLFLEF